MIRERRLPAFETGAWRHSCRSSMFLLFGFIALWRAEVNAADMMPQNAPAPELAIANPIAALPLDKFSATRDRPLFSPSRRPPFAPISHLALSEPGPPALPTPPPSIVLIGIVTQAHGSFAVVRTGTQAAMNDSISIRVGDQIKGWTVTQIEPFRLFLSRDDRLAAFTLFKGLGGLSGGVTTPTDEPNQPTMPSAPSDLRFATTMGRDIFKDARPPTP